jgi:ABC-2 type transport system ATP-binding protein
MRAPVLAIGDGALGFWRAAREVFPQARTQRCWFHKIANVLGALPKSAHPGAKKALAEIWNAEDKDHARTAVKAFAAAYGAKFPKAAAKITGDEEELLAFFDYPAEHWVHLRTTNHRIYFCHGPAADQGHQGPRVEGGRAGDGVQADRVRAAPLAHGQRPPPGRARPRRSGLRQRQARRTTRGRDRRGGPAGSSLKILIYGIDNYPRVRRGKGCIAPDRSPLDIDPTSGLHHGRMRDHARPPAPAESAPRLAIDAVGLARSFGDQHALTGLDLAVPEGSVTALIGPNGSGKTTTIRILSTLLAPDAGRAAVSGHDVVAEPEAVRAAIGVTGQLSAVDKFLTGRENLALMARLHHLRRAVALERTAGNLERFELTEAADRPVITYSGGMRRRLDLAMTLMGEPRIVFLDEPTTGLDPRGRKVLWRIVRDLVAGGVTVLLTTQYLEEADRLADRVVLIDRGALVAEGTPSELKKRAPGGRIRLQFAGDDALAAAAMEFDGAERGDDDLSLELASDGSVAGLRHVLDRLERHEITVEGLSAQPPDLDDVFFALTGGGPEPSGAHSMEEGR